jgi:hypothetical protein
MTSREKIAANRSNARKSRGPRTAAGKSRASLNALRHGLAATTRHKLALSPEIERIARTLCRDEKDPLLFEQALIIAENEIVLLGVRAARVTAIEQRRHDKDKNIEINSAVERGSVQKQPFEASQAVPQLDARELENEFDAMRRAMPGFDQLERFERRAWLHRKRAIRNFIEIKSNRSKNL